MVDRSCTMIRRTQPDARRAATDIPPNSGHPPAFASCLIPKAPDSLVIMADLARLLHGVNGRIEGFGFRVAETSTRRRMRLFERYGVAAILDVGAAAGRYGAEVRRAGFTGDITSFEPLDDAFAALLQRSARDQRWLAVNAALGNTAGEITINVAGNSDSSSILPMLERHRQAAPYANYVGTARVPITTIDTWLMENSVDVAARPTYLKIDAQGFEGAILDGAVQALPKLVGVQLEMSLVPLYEGSMTFLESIERVCSAGFDLTLLEPGFEDPTSAAQLQVDGVFMRT
jgi:FkbM family methyltransferase